jgi:hypothetical protein
VDHDVDVEIGMETADVHFEMKGMESLNRNFCPDAKYLKVGACLCSFFLFPGTGLCTRP